MNANFFIPQWPIPSSVKAICTTRLGGISQAPFTSFNLADHVQDDLRAVLHNRKHLEQQLNLNSHIQFLKQVHGNQAINLSLDQSFVADAAYTQKKQQVCAVLTADCLPLLVSNLDGTEVAAIHAGWRGLLAGIIDECIKLFQAPHQQLSVWLGPAIGPCHFEVNEEIRHAYAQKDSSYAGAFRANAQGLFGDLYQLARMNLQALGIQAIYGGNSCTYCESELFYSYRREQKQTGRFASLIWIAD